MLVVRRLRGRPAPQCKYLKSSDYLTGRRNFLFLFKPKYQDLTTSELTLSLGQGWWVGRIECKNSPVFLPPNLIFAWDCKPSSSFYRSSLGLRPQGWDEWKCILSIECWFLPPEIDVCGWTELTWCFVLLHSNIRHCSHREKIVYSSSEVIIDNVLRMSY